MSRWLARLQLSWPALGAVAALALVLSPVLLYRTPAADAAERPDPLPESPEPIHPLAPPPPGDALSALGRRLFSDRRLSADRGTSCASCHDLSEGGADTARLSAGVHGQLTRVNTPTVFNVTLSSRLSWSGAKGTLAAQVEDLAANPVVMGKSWADVAAELRASPEDAAAFRAAFRDGVSAANVRSALVAFLGTLVTPDAPFDRYLRGEEGALSAEAGEGYRVFKLYGCASCHQGTNVGGNMFQTFGVMGDYYRSRGTPETEADQGRYNVTGKDGDRRVFRVPSLRNVALTAPYFHDGSAATLGDAVAIMARHQLGRELTREQVARLVAFLESLTGERPWKKA